MASPVHGAFQFTLREMLWEQNADELKKLLALIPGERLKAPRKAEIVDALLHVLLGAGLPRIWALLSQFEQSAVAETAHSIDGTFDAGAIEAKYGKAPHLETKEGNSWQRQPKLMRLFIHPVGNDCQLIPRDLREKLVALVPKPAPARLASLEVLPDEAPRTRNVRRFDDQKKGLVYESHEVPRFERRTEQAAIQDLRTVLRLIDQGKIAVSATTLLPSKATMSLLGELLRDGDFFPAEEKANDWDPTIGPVKGFSWPLLVQAAKLAALRDGKLTLTKLGRSALAGAPEDALRDLWKAWCATTILDEFSRIDTIKGQKGKGGRGMTSPADRRLAIRAALAACPVGRWVETTEFSRFMRAAGYRFEVTRSAWGLYICDPQYGSLGYAGYGGWNILQERYLLCLLFEYAAPLGIVDIAYEHPAGARPDYKHQWGTDDLIFLSRYDGLKHIRLTPLGAYALGLSDRYVPSQPTTRVVLSVLPKRQIRLDQGELSPDQTLLIESFAERESDQLWSLSESRAIEAVEKGARIDEFRAFLKANDPQPLPDAVESFLNSVEQRGAACLCKGTCLLVECLSPEIAESIARDARAGTLCQRAGPRGLVVSVDKEEAFRKAINGLGYGMPRV